MFKLSVDQDIDLILAHKSLSPRYVELREQNLDYLSQWLAWPDFCRTEDDFNHFVTMSLHKYADGGSMTCAIQYQGEVVGNCSYNTIDHKLKKVEIGYWIGKPYQGKGIVTRVCQFLIDYAFNTLGIDKVQVSAAEGNLPSRAVCERLGMTLEGIITNREKVGDRILNHAVYGLHRQNKQ